MSYSCPVTSGIRINYFSNPDVFYLGRPTGIADDADCARRIRETMVRIRISKLMSIRRSANHLLYYAYYCVEFVSLESVTIFQYIQTNNAYVRNV